MRSTVFRAALVTAVLVFLLVIALALLLSFANRRNARLAEQMMFDTAQVRVHVSGLSDVRAFASKYHGQLRATHEHAPCTESDCLAIATVPTDEFWERHPKMNDWYIRILWRFGGVWQYSVWMWVAHGEIVAKEQVFTYSNKARDFAVIAESSPSDQSPRVRGAPGYSLPGNFVAYPAPHHFQIWVDANAPEQAELLRFDLSCVTTVRGCGAVSDVAPAAWHIYQTDEHAVGASQRR